MEREIFKVDNDVLSIQKEINELYWKENKLV